MKKQKTLVVIFGLAIGFAIGVMVGVTLTNPGMSLREAAGTIGRVDQYRNIRVTEADIELRNELLADSNMREAYRNYLAYEYAANIMMGDDLRFAISAGREHGDFRTGNARTLDRMEDYAIFLDNARLRILEAIGTISDLPDSDRVAIRTVLNSAGNAIAQTQFRKSVVFDFMMGVERFFDTNPKTQFPNLTKAHDQLFTNVLMSSMINDNRPVLEHLLAKELMDADGELIQMDMETLRAITINDIENLRSIAFMNEEVLKQFFYDVEALRYNFSVQNAERLSVLDAERLGMDIPIIVDAERLRFSTLDAAALPMNEILRGSEMMRNSDFLRDAAIRDGEQLRRQIF